MPEKASVLRNSIWLTRGFLAVLDQALFSGANFLVNILLARSLPPEEYGAFAVALSVFYLLAGFHTAVLSEPMMIFGAGKYREQFRKYFGMVLWIHWQLSALIALGLGVAAWAFFRLGSPSMAQALLGLAVASPFLLLIWLTRRACYVQLRPAWAVAGGGINLVAILGGLFFLGQSGLLTSLSGLVLLGVAAGLTSLFLVLQLKRLAMGPIGNLKASQVVSDHWRYGRWNLLNTSMFWASGQVIVLIASFFYGLHASATMAASWNLYAPLNLFIQGISLLILPSLADSRERGHLVSWKQMTFGFAVGFGGLALAYVAFLALFGQDVMKSVYGSNNVYSNYIDILILIGMHFVFTAIGGVFAASLKTAMQIEDMVKIRFASMVLFLMFAFPLSRFIGVSGLILATIIGEAFLTTLLCYKVKCM
jgi:O-antigen/teichoic acid export membrane protein